MQIALGFKSHSGWAAMSAVGMSEKGFEIIDRQRVELIDEGELWAKQPYHFAERLEHDEARRVVTAGIESAGRVAIRQIRSITSVLNRSGHRIVACGVLTPGPMPSWTIDEILAVHFRMHKAEGILFPDSLCKAARTCKLSLVVVPEKQLDEHLRAIPGISGEALASLGKSIGPPWGKDQRSAAAAAIVALNKIQEEA